MQAETFRYLHAFGNYINARVHQPQALIPVIESCSNSSETYCVILREFFVVQNVTFENTLKRIFAMQTVPLCILT